MFSLGEWSPQIPTGFHVSRGTWEPGPGSPSRFRLRGYHPLWRTFPDPSANGQFGNSPTSPQLVRPSPATPDRQRLRAITPVEFRLFPVRSPLLGESRLLSFPRGTEMFQFPRFASRRLCIQRRIREHYLAWVPPFGHPRINACLRLPAAYRSLPRPSSLPGAKASTVRP
jgi:hypothetical protein